MASQNYAVRQLDAVTIDQIAAGEVVERPASVVKELVENALDSGARSVEVTVQEGGLAAISVADDGCGMDPANAALAVLRHATSKIRVADDLQQIATYGFRGEALSSIASVSRLTLTTRRKQDDVGFRLQLQGGKVVAQGPYGCPVGTHLQVEDLFGNVPARRKFLRAAVTEQAYVQEALLRCLLGARRGGIIYTAGKRRLLDVAHDCPPAERAARLLGRRVRQLTPFASTNDDLILAGQLSPPALTRGETSGLWLFVNGRFVRDRMLQRAAMEGYQLAFPGGFPTALIYLDLPADMVDVNVHPQKLEVRFRDAHHVFCAVRDTLAVAANSLRATCAPAALRPAASSPASVELALPECSAPTAGTSKQDGVACDAPAEDARISHASGGALLNRRVQRADVSRKLLQPQTRPSSFTSPDVAVRGPAALDLAAPATLAWPDLRPLGLAPRGYLACAAGEDLVLVALAPAFAAAARVCFAAAADALAGVALHRLLLPPRFTPMPALRGRVAAFVEACKDAASGSPCGLHLQPVGDGAYLVQAVPACFAACAPIAVVETYFRSHAANADLSLAAWLEALNQAEAWPQGWGPQARWPTLLFAALQSAQIALQAPLALRVNAAALLRPVRQ